MSVTITRPTLLLLVAMVAFSPASPGNAQDDEPNQKISSELRELLSSREELSEYLEELSVERQRAEIELRETNELVQLRRELEGLELELDRNEYKRSNEEKLQLIVNLEQSIERIRRRRDLRRTAFLTTELRSRVPELLEELDDESARRALLELESALGEGAANLRRLLTHLEKTPPDGLAPTPASPQQESALAEVESPVEPLVEVTGLLEELRWAFEEDEHAELEPLLRELHQELVGAAESPTTVSAGKSPPAPELLPVAITKQQLERYSDRDFQKSVVPLLKTFCFDCHSNDASYGELNLEQLIEQRPLVANRQRWINVIEQAKNRVMPPEDGVQPAESERQALVLSLHNMIHNYDYKGIDNPGFEATRRLTHEEYDNTVSDLFGVEIKVAERFPKELAGTSGFNNSGNTLFVQPLLLERYLTAADEIVAELLPDAISTPSQRTASNRVFFRKPQNEQDSSRVANSIMNRFVSHAYRRPLEEDEKERLASRYRTLRQSGVSHQEGIRTIIRETLVSPNFLFKFEELRSESGKFRVDDWELASRLSYFLWASKPDDELFRLAKSNRLHLPEVLDAQVLRMLNAPKANSLGEIFAAQWLGSQHVGTRVRLDPIDNPWCTDSLMAAMREETALFFSSLVRENAKIGDLINGKHTFVNDELAKHYGIRGVRGSQMRRIEIEDKDRRGVLGHASVLAVTSFPYRTSPVVRGKWVLDTLLGTPPPPPPPNVSELSEELLENDRLTVRQKLERHRRSPSCSACHSEMDPLGLALENYDWFGRYRNRYERGRIDSRGSLPNGTEFDGLAGLRNVIIEQRHDDLVRQVASKLLSYALGRQLEYYDEPALRKVLNSLAAEDYRFQSLITAIVRSEPFQYKQVQAADRGSAVSSSTAGASQ